MNNLKIIDRNGQDVIWHSWTYGARGKVHEITKHVPPGAQIIGLKVALVDDKIARLGFKLWMPKNNKQSWPSSTAGYYYTAFQKSKSVSYVRTEAWKLVGKSGFN